MASLASQPRRRIADSGLSSVIPAVIGIGDGEGIELPIDYTINNLSVLEHESRRLYSIISNGPPNNPQTNKQS